VTYRILITFELSLSEKETLPQRGTEKANIDKIISLIDNYLVDKYEGEHIEYLLRHSKKYFIKTDKGLDDLRTNIINHIDLNYKSNDYDFKGLVLVDLKDNKVYH
jgi:hypothetical protein